MLSLRAHFPQWDRIPVTTHSSSCHTLRRFSMKHLSFSPFISSRMACSLTYHCISLLDIPLWFWVGCFNVTSILSSFFFPKKDVFARPSGPGALRGRGVKAVPVRLLMQTLALPRRQHHSPQEGRGSAPQTGCHLFPHTN